MKNGERKVICLWTSRESSKETSESNGTVKGRRREKRKETNGQKGGGTRILKGNRRLRENPGLEKLAKRLSSQKKI